MIEINKVNNNKGIWEKSGFFISPIKCNKWEIEYNMEIKKSPIRMNLWLKKTNKRIHIIGKW